jgi:hypothetical protein
MNVKNLFVPSALVLSSVLFFGCTNIKPIEVITTEQARVQLNLAEPKPLKPRLVKWFVITPENADEVFADMQEKKYDLVLFGLTDDGYENLAMNAAEWRKYIIEQSAIIKAYKKYYETEEKKND